MWHRFVGDVFRQGIVTRMLSIGLILPKEYVWGVIIKAAQVAGLDVPDEKASVAHVRTMKGMLTKRRKNMTSPIVNFPLDPKELACFSEAYQDDQPVALKEAHVMMKSATLRDSHKNVRGLKNAKVNPKAETLQLAQPPTPDFATQMRHFGMMLNYMMNQGSMNPDAASSAGPKPKQPKMIMDKEPSTPAAPAVETDSQDMQMSPNQTPSTTEKKDAVLLDVPQTSTQPSTPPCTTTMKRPAAAAQGSAKSKAKAQTKPKAMKKKLCKAKGKVMAGLAKPKAKPADRTVQKAVQTVHCAKGWTMEIRTRDSGQKDKHFQAPDGTWFRVIKSAKKYGFPGEP